MIKSIGGHIKLTAILFFSSTSPLTPDGPQNWFRISVLMFFSRPPHIQHNFENSGRILQYPASMGYKKSIAVLNWSSVVNLILCHHHRRDVARENFHCGVIFNRAVFKL